MSNKKKPLAAAVAMAAAAGLLGVVPAPETGAAEILKSMEDRTIGPLAPKDMSADMKMTIESGGQKKVRELRSWMKNNADADDWRLLKFVSPAEVRDLGLLVLSESEMYLYLPEFHRTRRIASSSKKDAFIGSDFSYEDLGTAAFSASYEPALRREEESGWTLELTRKPGADKPYARIVLEIARESRMPRRMELYDNAGNLWKVAEETAQKNGAYWVMASIRMGDRKRGSSTLIEFRNVKTDGNLGGDIFTERFLKRPGQ